MAVEIIVETDQIPEPSALMLEVNRTLRSSGLASLDIVIIPAQFEPTDRNPGRFVLGESALVDLFAVPVKDGVTWLVFDASGLRTPQSLLLAALLSVLTATIGHGHVLDESNLLGEGRRPGQTALLRALEEELRMAGDFDTASRRRFGHLFGEDPA